MPRGPRLDAPGVFHHVWARGIERRKIFLNDDDREDFLQRLTMLSQDGACFIYAWSLMDNHFHLAFRTGKVPLSNTMRRLMTGYAVRFNRKKKRSGHLFQNRYGSTIVDEDVYFLRLIRYIHLNPLWAGIVRNLWNLNKYKWTGHSVLMGNAEHSFQVVDEVLGMFSKRAGAARRALQDFMREKEARQDQSIFGGGGLVRSMGGVTETIRAKNRDERQMHDERVLGDGSFVESVLAEIECDEQPKQSDGLGLAKKLERLIKKTCKRAKVSAEELRQGSRRRQVARVREVISHLALRRFGMSAAAVARVMSVRAYSVSRAAERGAEAMRVLKLKEKDLVN